MKIIKLMAKRPFSDVGGMVVKGQVIERKEDVAKDYVERGLCKYMTHEWDQRQTKVEAPQVNAPALDVELKTLSKPKRRTRAKKSD